MPVRRVVKTKASTALTRVHTAMRQIEQQQQQQNNENADQATGMSLDDKFTAVDELDSLCSCICCCRDFSDQPGMRAVTFVACLHKPLCETCAAAMDKDCPLCREKSKTVAVDVPFTQVAELLAAKVRFACKSCRGIVVGPRGKQHHQCPSRSEASLALLGRMRKLAFDSGIGEKQLDRIIIQELTSAGGDGKIPPDEVFVEAILAAAFSADSQQQSQQEEELLDSQRQQEDEPPEEEQQNSQSQQQQSQQQLAELAREQNKENGAKIRAVATKKHLDDDLFNCMLSESPPVKRPSTRSSSLRNRTKAEPRAK